MPQDSRLPDNFVATANQGSESSKYLKLTVPYLVGNGVDIGSGGWPVVPWAIQIEQPAEAYRHYTNGKTPDPSIEWLGDICNLPFKDDTLDWVYSSHLIEDFYRENSSPEQITWPRLFKEWKRVLKPGGVIVLLVPDKDLWAAAIARGQPPNCAHYAPEPSLGDLSRTLTRAGFAMIEERLTANSPEDYSILGVARKL